MKLLAVSILLSILLLSCSEKSESLSQGDLEVISIDLSKAYDGKLSEFFDPEVDYVWLKDDSEEAQLSAGLHKILFYKDKIMTMDIFGCKCIKVFDSKGNFLNEIHAFGDGPEKYLEFNNFIIDKNEVLFLGVYPPKLMWFDMEGNFLKERKTDLSVKDGVYNRSTRRYYFSNNLYGELDFIAQSVNDKFKDTINYFPYLKENFYGDFLSESKFNQYGEEVYFSMAFQDTVFQILDDKFVPIMTFDFGKYGQDLNEMKKYSEELDPLENLNFINNKAKLYYNPYFSKITSRFLATNFGYEKTSYIIFYDRDSKITSVLNRRFVNDIDEGYNPYFFNYNFDGANQVGSKIPGVDLYEVLQ